MYDEIIPDVLAMRYTEPQMRHIWSRHHRVKLARELWVAILKAQREFGMSVPAEAIDAYERVIDQIDLESIRKREIVLRHDNLAEIEEFNALAGFQLVHQRLTTRDKDDNLDQFQIFAALKLTRNRHIAVLKRFGDAASTWVALDITGRTHFMPAQTTTLGKRFANIAEELLRPFERLEELVLSYPMRGIKGPVGTQGDVFDLLKNREAVRRFEDRVREHLGLPALLTSVGQVYPRSLDFEVLALLAQLASPLGNFAKMVRISAGLGLMHEGFGPGQKGSSSMPHKRNARTSERINGFVHILCGYLRMVEGLLGDQWFEGDVSCSVVRRVALPGAFFAMSGLTESALTVLDEMEVFERPIAAEVDRYLPFLSTARLLGAATNAGMGREEAHTAIMRHSIAALQDIERGGSNTFLDRLVGDESFPLSDEEVRALVKPDHGLAEDQVESVEARIFAVTSRDGEAAAYRPSPIL